MVDVSIEALRLLVSNANDNTADGWSSIDIEVPFDLRPKDFLNFAESDLNNICSHGSINALTNIKRAIDCQLDSLLYAFGLLEISKENRWSFPYKSELLTKIGVVSPRILKKINQKRNLLEHDYAKPDAEQVEDALDIANLFLLYTNKYLLNALTECELFDQDRNDLAANLLYKEHKIILSCRDWIGDKSVGDKVLKEINAGSKEYLDYLSWFISLYKLRR